MGKDKKKKGSLKRKLLLGTLGVGVIIAAGVGYIWTAASSELEETFEQKAVALDLDDGDLDRGKYLVDHVMSCNNEDCHRADFGGGVMMDNGAMGLIYAPNLTGGDGSKVKDYTPEDWDRAIRHGVKRDKTRALIMPSEDYWAFPDKDIASVVAYIKSQPAVNRESKEQAPGPIARMLLVTGEVKFAYDKIDHNKGPLDVEPDNTKDYGEVLITTCTGCHGHDLNGGPIVGADPKWPPAANLTQNEGDGIGKWSQDDFFTAMREGKRPDGTDVKYPMPWKAYAGMTDDDLEALWLYLKDVSAKETGE
ncbi:MAG: c-type cytochrome [Planctomycetota bacterium]